MIAEFVKAWDNNRKALKDWIAQQDQSQLSYKTILEALITKVINPTTENKWNASKITEIDDGDYQGCQIFIIPLENYSPGPYEYFVTYQYYGSCSGCDLLEGIREYQDGKPSRAQIHEYMTLALHLLQRCKYLFEDNEETEVGPFDTIRLFTDINLIQELRRRGYEVTAEKTIKL